MSVQKTITLYKVKQLKAIHQLVLLSNDEEIYHEWVETFPDEPSEEDFELLATDEIYFIIVVNKFLELITRKNFF